jgi:hypothetical protein
MYRKLLEVFPTYVEYNTKVEGYMSLSVDEEQLRALKSYIKLGYSMVDDKIVNMIVHWIRSMSVVSRNHEESITYDRHWMFLFLEGSSGKGKSQMVFTVMLSFLGKHLPEKYNCHIDRNHRLNSQELDCGLLVYLTFQHQSETSQAIYQNFQNISNLFQSCLSRDKYFFFNPREYFDSSAALQKLPHKATYTYGFIFEVMQNYQMSNLESNESLFLVERKRRQDIIDLVTKRRLKYYPTFIIDECVAIDSYNKAMLRFLRKLFHDLRFGLVILGTDSRAAQLHDTIGATSRGGPLVPFCKVIGEFPAVSVRTFDEFYGFEAPAVLTPILQNSRPWFVHLFYAYLKQHEGTWRNMVIPSLIDAIARHAFNEICTAKNIYNNVFGRLGQLNLFKNSSFDLETQLVNNHFASLCGPASFELWLTSNNEYPLNLLQEGNAEEPFATWTPRSTFPPVDTDVLLHLFLGGGKRYQSFMASQMNVSFRYYAELLQNDLAKFQSSNQNSAQPGNDGNELEASCTAILIASSRQNGVCGILLEPYLCLVLYHLRSGKDAVEPNGIEGLPGGFKNLRIPYLLPPNQKSDILTQLQRNCNEFCFDQIYRSTNFERIDISTGTKFLSGECKDHNKSTGYGEVVKIIHRIPETSKVHLVFTNSLVKFSETSPMFPHTFKSTSKRSGETVTFKQEFKNSPSALNAVFFECSPRSQCLKPIPGLPSQHEGCQRIVIFIQDIL